MTDLRFLSLWMGFQTGGYIFEEPYLFVLAWIFLVIAYREDLREYLPKLKDWILYEKIGVSRND